jgi:hypothetical protein
MAMLTSKQKKKMLKYHGGAKALKEHDDYVRIRDLLMEGLIVTPRELKRFRSIVKSSEKRRIKEVV